MPETKEEAAPRRFRLSRFLIFLAIVLSVVFVALYSFFNINPLDAIKSGLDGIYQSMIQTVGESNQKVTEVFSNDAGEQLSYGALSNGIAVGSVSAVRFIDSDGTERWYVPVTLKKPLIRTVDQDILVADLGGRYFGIIRDGKILWDKTIDMDIVNANFSKDWVLLITKSDQTGYKRTIHAYSRDGQEIAFRNISDYYPISAYHFPQFDAADFIVCGVETQSLETASLFEFLDLSMNQKGSFRGANEIYTGALPFSEGKLLLSGEKSLICVDKALGTLWNIDLGSDFLTASGITPGGTTVAALLNGEILGREKRQQTALKMINSQGAVTSSTDIDAAVTGVETAGRTIACVAGSEVYFMNDKGEIMDMYTSRSPVDEVCLANEGLAYVIGGGIVVSVKVKVKDKFLGIF